MGDRELLELAAKAAGIEFNDKRVCYPSPDLYIGPKNGRGWWNPLTDDGDALRLAVKLRLDVCISVCRVGGEDGWYNAEADEIGIEAATRRAIVKAAAEIGRNKEQGDGGGT